MTGTPNPALAALEDKWRDLTRNANWYDKKQLPKLKTELERATRLYQDALKDRDAEVADANVCAAAIVALGGTVPDE